MEGKKLTGPFGGPPRLAIFAFSFCHIVISGCRVSSWLFWIWNSSSVSRRICCTLMSRPSRSSSFVVATNFPSRFFVNVGPGFSARIRTSMMALYCTYARMKFSFDRNLRITLAASFAAAGLDSAASTITGRCSTSSPCLAILSVFLYLVPRSVRTVLFGAPDSQNSRWLRRQHPPRHMLRREATTDHPPCRTGFGRITVDSRAFSRTWSIMVSDAPRGIGRVQWCDDNVLFCRFRSPVRRFMVSGKMVSCDKWMDRWDISVSYVSTTGACSPTMYGTALRAKRGRGRATCLASFSTLLAPYLPH